MRFLVWDSGELARVTAVTDNITVSDLLACIPQKYDAVTDLPAGPKTREATQPLSCRKIRIKAPNREGENCFHLSEELTARWEVDFWDIVSVQKPFCLIRCLMLFLLKIHVWLGFPLWTCPEQ